MGLHYMPNVDRPSFYPGTPPHELDSPGSSYSTSNRLPENRSYKPTAPVSPPMSTYEPRIKPEMAINTDVNGAGRRREAEHGAPKLQLPSLSSIFGPAQIRPLNSPVSDRQSPVYSPLDGPRSVANGRERSHSNNSYFPPGSSPTQSRSPYELRLDHNRAPIPPLGFPLSGPVSPTSRDFEQARPVSRTEPGPSPQWASPTSQPDPRRPEYVLGSRDSQVAYRSPHDRFPHPAPLAAFGHDLRASGPFRSGAPPHLSGSPTLATTESLTVKDGLGPKIWTGTHFLPRFVRQSDVPGEGLCYFYDDGSHCKAIIDGEQVNAHWGVTKAGKPRKRLAIACLTCREKKIKCDPDFPRCVQCEKFGRICKFKNAPRGGHNPSSESGFSEHDEPRSLESHSSHSSHSHSHSHSQSCTSLDDHRRPRSSSSTPVSPRSLTRRSPEYPTMPSKRQRVSYEHYQPNEPPLHYYQPAAEMRASPTYSGSAPSTPWEQRELPRIHDAYSRGWYANTSRTPL